MILVRTKYTMCWVIGVLLLVGCNRKEEFAEAYADGLVSVRLKDVELTGAVEEDAGMNVKSLKGFRFENGMLKEVFASLRVDEKGQCSFRPLDKKGEVYFLANGESVEGVDGLRPGVSSLDDFMELETSCPSVVADALPMTGMMPFADAGTSSSVRMKRSVARVDLSSFVKGVVVKSVVVRNVLLNGYVNESDVVRVPQTSKKSDFERTFGDAAFTNCREPLLYLAEQKNDALFVEIMVDFNGSWHRIETRLPDVIRRNTVYNLQIRGLGASLAVNVLSGDWENGEDISSENRPLGLVSPSASEFSEGVRISAANDTVYVPYYGAAFRLALEGEKDGKVEVDGIVPGVVVRQTTARNLQHIADVSVSSAVRMPGTTTDYLYLNMYSQGVLSGRVVLVFEENPVKLEGKISFDSERVCDFGRYIDGELARITLPEGWNIRLEFAEGSPRWMKLDGQEGVWRVLGGWKPNDPNADGRVQEARIVISGTDGLRDTYTVKRVNWGLPVVNIHGTWWCKYNLRGNVKRFEDQITIQKDPASHEELAGYLMTCDEEELLELMGEQYQGGNPDGMPLSHDGSNFYYDGMKSSAQNFGTMDPAEMAPDGYRIPSYEDYAFYSWGDNVNMGGVGSRPFNNKTGQRLNVTVSERDVSFLGRHFGVVAFYDFQLDGKHWVLFGLGHQWNTVPGNISRMNILLATYGHPSSTWGMEGYSNAEKPGNNWFKFVPQNSLKTRTVRCIKTPVEYIYD